VVYEVIRHWMSDPFTGSIKATVTHGVLVENGAPAKPVKGVVLGDNVYDWLSKSLVEVGSDIEVHGNIASPTIWVREVKVAGKSSSSTR
jgi:PmbA protein